MTLYLRYVKGTIGVPFTPLVIPLADSICDGFSSKIMIRVHRFNRVQSNWEGEEEAKMEIAV